MTKTEFINDLNFDVVKRSIAKKLGIKASDLSLKSYRTGDFRVNLKNTSSNIDSLLYGARKAILTTNNVVIKEDKDNKDNFSYKANVDINLKNRSGEYSSTIGKINLDKNKLVFVTMNEINKKPEVINTIEA